MVNGKITKRDGTYYPNSYYYSWTNDNKHKQDQYPKISAEAGKQGSIIITSKLPVNYFPKQFVFGVHNAEDLKVSGIIVRQKMILKSGEGFSPSQALLNYRGGYRFV